MIDLKPARRYRATQADWSQYREQLADETCWCCGGRWESLHHIYPRSQGGDDVLANLAPVCGDGTRGCHGRLEARDPVARSLLRHALMPSHVVYLEGKLGDGTGAWLDRNYARAAA